MYKRQRTYKWIAIVCVFIAFFAAWNLKPDAEPIIQIQQIDSVKLYRELLSKDSVVKSCLIECKGKDYWKILEKKVSKSHENR